MIKELRKPLILFFLLVAVAYPLSAPGSDVLSGRSESLWREYLEQSAGEEVLEGFARQVEGRRPEPMDFLGDAVLLDSRENLDKAQSAYFDAVASVWMEGGELRCLDDLSGQGLLFQPEAGIDQEDYFHALWLWAIGTYSLKSSDTLLPYSLHPMDYIARLRGMAEEEHVPLWRGFYDLQSQARFSLQQALLKKGKFEEAQAWTDELGFVRNFMWIGPFPNKEESGYSQVFAPEKAFNEDGEYEGKTGPVRWRVLKPYPSWGYVNLKGLVAPLENSTAYGLSWIQSGRARRVMLEFGHAGAAKVWVAGRLVVAEDAYHEAGPFQVSVPCDLSAGWNPVLVKISCKEPQSYGFYLRFTDTDGRTLKSGVEGIQFWNRADKTPSCAECWPVKKKPEPPVNERNRALIALADEGQEPLAQALGGWLAASIFHQTGSLDENSTTALELIRQSEKLYPDSSLFQRCAGLVDRDENRSRQAYEKAAALDPGEVLALSQLARHYLKKPYKDRMLSVVEKGLIRSGDSPRLWLLRGEALLKQTGQEMLAAEAFRKGIELAPEYGYGYFRLAETSGQYLNIKRRNELRSEALLKDRSAGEVRLSLMEGLVQAGQESKAFHLAEEGLKADPFDTRPLVLIARHARAKEDWQAAEGVIERALEIQPLSAEVNRLAGEIYHAQGQDEKALAVWRTALSVRPNLPELEEYAGLIESATGEDYYSPYRIDLEQLAEADPADYPEAQNIVLLDHEVQRVHPNGTSSRTVHLIRQALTDSGVSNLRSHGIYFEPAGEKVKIKRARVIRTDGTVYDAPKPNVRSARGGAADRIYGDYSVMIVRFPSVEKGAVVDLEYEIEQTGVNIYTDYFGSMFFFGSSEPVLLTEYVLITPTGREFYHKVVEPDPRYELPEYSVFDSIPERLAARDYYAHSVEQDQRIEVWSFSGRPLIQLEPGMPPLPELLPYVKVSTFEHWGEMTQWYWDLIKDQFIADEAVRQKTQELIQRYASQMGKPVEELTDLEIVKALNRFINTQIRYLGLEFGIHGYKPHRASEILSAQYGDCKDKAALMVAMAGQQGIEGRLTLLRTRDRGRIDLDLPSLGLFNHAIIYFPDLDGEPFVLDGTAQYFGTTELPIGDQGVKLLTIKEGGGYEFVTSPISSATKNRAIYETDLALMEDGSASGFSRTTYQGLFNPSVRSIYENKGKVKETIEKRYGGSLPGTTVSEIELSDLDNYEDPEWIQYQVNIPRMASRPAGQPNRLIFRPVIFPNQMTRSFARLPERKHELLIPYNLSRFRRVEISLPEGYRVVQIPESTKLKSPFGHYQMKCIQDNSKIVFEEDVAIENEDLRIQSEEYQDFREFCARVDRAQEQAVVLERTGS